MEAARALTTTMERYKTVIGYRCMSGHFDFFDDRVDAESPEQAQAMSLETLKDAKCHFCGAASGDTYEVMGTEKAPPASQTWCLGYTCKCGEKVVVFAAEPNSGISPPPSVTVSCSKGHERTILNNEAPYLDSWSEAAN